MPGILARVVALFLVLSVAAPPPAGAQVQLGPPGIPDTRDRVIQWRTNVREVVERARQTALPMLVWVPEEGRILDDDTYRSAQRLALNHPLVVGLIQDRFIPVRLNRVLTVRYAGGYAYQAPLLPVPYGPSLTVLAPDGTRIATFGPAEATDPFTLTDQLAAASHAYRDYLFRNYLRPVLTDPEASRSELRDALDMVWRLDIYSADSTVSDLALNPPEALNIEDQRNLFMLLSRLATPTTIAALLQAAREHAAARDALADAPQRAAGFLRRFLDDEDPLRRRLAASAIEAITGTRPSSDASTDG